MYLPYMEALWDLIPLMGLIKKFKAFISEFFSKDPIVYCKAFEDNSGAL